MRTLYFKGISLETGKIVYGSAIRNQYEDGLRDQGEYSIVENTGKLHKTFNNSVKQLTEHTDSNNKGLWEGDFCFIAVKNNSGEYSKEESVMAKIRWTNGFFLVDRNGEDWTDYLIETRRADKEGVKIFFIDGDYKNAFWEVKEEYFKLCA